MIMMTAVGAQGDSPVRHVGIPIARGTGIGVVIVIVIVIVIGVGSVETAIGREEIATVTGAAAGATASDRVLLILPAGES